MTGCCSGCHSAISDLEALAHAVQCLGAERPAFFDLSKEPEEDMDRATLRLITMVREEPLSLWDRFVGALRSIFKLRK